VRRTRERKDGLVTTRSVREIALGLPGVEESRVGRQVRYGVAARRFATRPRGRRLLLLRLSSREQQVLTQVRPAEFSRAPHRARGWTRIDLRRVDPWLLEELLVAAWRRVATLRRVAAWDAARATAAPPRQRTSCHGTR
jgi:hypothetical protein